MLFISHFFITEANQAIPIYIVSVRSQLIDLRFKFVK